MDVMFTFSLWCRVSSLGKKSFVYKSEKAQEAKAYSEGFQIRNRSCGSEKLFKTGNVDFSPPLNGHHIFRKERQDTQHNHIQHNNTQYDNK